ncbi:MAG TPA: manganese-dependent inorganic pyrophosphatase [Nanoarchaeota archaeon]|nr:manganese-dependent inorganic pyrophosphatase [Nanoarchaeota archaeon]
MIWVIGHKNPDTDSIVSAIVYAKKINAKPARAGKLNPETEFVLQKFGIEAPELKEKIEKNEKVVIVDTNNKEELIPIEGEIIEIIDHHRLFGNLSTANPIEVCIKPVGSTSTIIAERFINNLTKEEAGLLLSGILSDTVIFKSPTTTEKDKEIAKKLAEIAGIENIESFGIELKSKASQLSDNPKENVLRDFKITEINNTKFGIGQVEIIGYEKVMERKQEYLEAMEEIRKEKNLDFVLFMVTDIIDEGTKLLIVGENPEKIAKAFEKELKDGYIYLPKVMSRKKQIMPVLYEKFK